MFIRICVGVSVLLDLKNGELNTNLLKKGYNKQNFFQIHNNAVQIYDLKITMRDLQEKNNNKALVWKKLYSDSMIELFELNQAILIGFWQSTNVKYLFSDKKH